MATHSSIRAWKISWTEELGGLQSMGSQSQTQLSAYTPHFNSQDNSRIKLDLFEEYCGTLRTQNFHSFTKAA